MTDGDTLGTYRRHLLKQSCSLGHAACIIGQSLSFNSEELPVKIKPLYV